MPSAYSYPSRHSSRNHFIEPPSLSDRFISSLPHNLIPFVDRPISRKRTVSTRPKSRILLHIRRAQQRLPFKRLVTLPNLLILIWVLVLWWGERGVFRGSIRDCQWSKWEKWPSGANPHHLIFIADPQLVDPHTYPGRPWPLSTLTMRHTDLYLTRSYSLMQRILHPDTLIFLGDFFDGGREWATSQEKSHSPEEQYRKYGQDFWLREYERFGRIFFDHWGDGGMQPRKGQRGRKMIASLPGNHDLGLGVGIQRPVRDRYGAYFGEGNRVDVVGNHTFVSVDTVSLSAMSQADPSTGSQGSGESRESNTELEKIWKPVDEFLNGAQATKRRAVGREIRFLNGKTEELRHEHTVSQMRDTRTRLGSLDAGEGSAEFPTILLTHVPLYRLPGTACGPQREHWPPSTARVDDKDERNAIAIRAGYQYQNVLTPEISRLVLEKVGNVAHVFSGDDHDYCDVLHKGYTSGAAATTGEGGGGGIREITVKSMSWAMGVRKPGFLLLSLWNPVDEVGNAVVAEGSNNNNNNERNATSTMQSHLCLLPDQLGIFITYIFLLAFTLLALTVRAVLRVFYGSSASNTTVTTKTDLETSGGALLPISARNNRSDEGSKAVYYANTADDEASPVLITSRAENYNLSERTNNRARSSPSPPSPSHSPSTAALDPRHFQPAQGGGAWSVNGGGGGKMGGFRGRGGASGFGLVRVVSREVGREVLKDVVTVGAWWVWLVWWG